MPQHCHERAQQLKNSRKVPVQAPGSAHRDREDVEKDGFRREYGEQERGNSLTPGLVQGLPDALRLPVIDSYNDALLPIFLFMVPLTVMALVLLFFVVEKPLATQIDREVITPDSDEIAAADRPDPSDAQRHGTDPAVSGPSPATLDPESGQEPVSTRR